MKKWMNSRLSILCLSIGLLAGQGAAAYGVTGHRVVAEIAQRNLSKKTLSGLKELVGAEGLAYWSNWPDFIKSDTTHTWEKASPWHYVDLPGHISKDSFIADLKKLKGENLYTQIPAMMAQMKNKSLPLEKRRQALYFLVHFLGDLHQPLHVGRHEDQGGNKIPVYWFEKKTNLHTLWDTDLINFQQYSFTEYASVLNKGTKTAKKKLQAGTLEDWFYESHLMSDKIYDQSPAESKLSYKYNYIFQQDLENLLLKGGLRLARLLNEAFM